MLLTIKKLNLNFEENLYEMREKLGELLKLEEQIENSTHYKLLSGKTQMLGRNKGVTQKERSRLVHTAGVTAVTVKTINNIYDKFLEYNPDLKSPEYKEMFELNRNISLARGRIMAKAHDIGHVPCGHQGEASIAAFFKERKDSLEIQEKLEEHRRYFGEEYEKNQGHIKDKEAFSSSIFPIVPRVSLSFEHNELSAICFNRIYEKSEVKLSASEIKRLTLGVLGHSTQRTKFKLIEDDLIAQIVRVADKVEYINADFDEIRSLINIDKDMEEKLLEYIQKPLNERLIETSKELSEEAFRIGIINEEHETMSKLAKLRKSYDSLIYKLDGVYTKQILDDLLKIADDPEKLKKYYQDYKGVEVLYPMETLQNIKRAYYTLKTSSDILERDDAVQTIVKEQIYLKGVMQGENADRIFLMYNKVLKYYEENPDRIPQDIQRKVNPIDPVKSKEISYEIDSNYSNLQKNLEYISVMDDKTFLQTYKELVEERIQKGPGFGIEPISMEEIKNYSQIVFDTEVQRFQLREKLDTYTSSEVVSLYIESCKEFYEKRLSEDGQEAREESYRRRFEEYYQDYEDCQRMIKADEERQPKGEKEKTEDAVTKGKTFPLKGKIGCSKMPKLKRASVRKKEERD